MIRGLHGLPRLPRARGLYDPSFEKDACGLGFVAQLRSAQGAGGPSHDVVSKGLEVLRRLSHRGAAGADPSTGDGAGILIQIPHAFYERVLSHRDIELPLAGDYGVAQCFLSRDPARAEAQMGIVEDVVRYHNQKVIGWRDVPVDDGVLGPVARKSRPVMRQLFIARMCPAAAFERVLFTIRKRAGRLVSTKLAPAAGSTNGDDDFYIASLSSKTVVYKGLMLPERIDGFYLDLRQDDVRSALALVHSRFSTNTFPTWDRAHPYRRIAHNGEINTLRGNQTWMAAREALLASRDFGEHLADFKPIIRPQGSDSASLDNVVDFLVAGGRSLPHVMMMLVPEAWATQADMAPEKRGFYEYHASLVEPWDGPAALVFTDGTLIGATLDRNGLRPAKFVVTKGGLVVLASELGVLDIDPADVAQKGRLQPGKMFLVDTGKGRIIGDEEIKTEIATRKPYAQWVADNKIELAQLPTVTSLFTLSAPERERLQRTFGYTREDLRVLLATMATTGEEPTGSMGNDAALAVLSDRPTPLFRYFKQQFAQVTNPPIDPIREELVMSLVTCVGGEGNLLDETPRQCRLLELPHPILSNAGLAKFLAQEIGDFKTARVPTTFSVRGDHEAQLAEAIEAMCGRASRAVDEGASILVLSDRDVDAWHAPIPSVLAVSAVHHHLIRQGKRVRCGIVVETGEAREVADVALLIGYGAGAVNPYLAFDSIHAMAQRGEIKGEGAAHADKNYVKALKKGLLKILSKMGISTLSSYHGAQIFEAVGIRASVIDAYFPGTSSRIGGVGLGEIAREAVAKHASAFHSGEAGANGDDEGALDVGGVYAWRKDGERHLWSPKSIASLQRAVRLEDAQSYAEYARLINEQSTGGVGGAPAFCTLRGLLDFAPLAPQAALVPLDEVEPAKAIVKRFATGAMSFGSISREAHENLAIAMNRIGGKSNTGEGGEDEGRFVPDAPGPDGRRDLRRSAIKQVASARFGVTTHYLVNADELQIKMAQGAKPGEGGQLPGHKVSEEIARVRHSTPGVTLISPPPHHDIYSIEDLAQLIFDLKNVSPRARVSVKLVSESGVGTVAAGVAKAHADNILVAGHDGGTGASPLSSIQHAGTPWELGLAEAQQVLVLNGLRSRVVLQVDGQLKTGRDVAIAALLGAEEFGFATAPLVASGCVMMRKCHLNTCPVGIATQDPELRARFKGTPEHVVNYFFFVAEELRAIMATLGFRTVDEMVGRVECLAPRAIPETSAAPGQPGWGASKARGIDLAAILTLPARREPSELHCTTRQPNLLAKALDKTVISRVWASVDRQEPTSVQLAITNADRAFGAMLAGEIAQRHGARGLPEDTIRIDVTGTAGQSFGAFAVRGMTIALEGDANDYVGKGLSGGILAIRPSPRATYVADENVIVGNTVLYGATAGRVFFSGRAGERFAVRNSGAQAVVEGTGDHGCEYMTGGTVVILGTTGRNFAAGMSGGIAYVLDEDGAFASRCNTQMVEVGTLDAEDERTVRALVAEHVKRTGSVKGERVLGAWDAAAFVKVLPLEYKRVLAERAKRESAATPSGAPERAAG
jgi:glutamate synthase (NADPH/NADH) large chain